MSEQWTALEVANWLARDVRLPEYADVFLAHDVTGNLLPLPAPLPAPADFGLLLCGVAGHRLRSIDDSDLLNLGVHSALHRKRIILCIDRLRANSASPKPGTEQVRVLLQPSKQCNDIYGVQKNVLPPPAKRLPSSQDGRSSLQQQVCLRSSSIYVADEMLSAEPQHTAGAASGAANDFVTTQKLDGAYAAARATAVHCKVVPQWSSYEQEALAAARDLQSKV